MAVTIFTGFGTPSSGPPTWTQSGITATNAFALIRGFALLESENSSGVITFPGTIGDCDVGGVPAVLISDLDMVFQTTLVGVLRHRKFREKVWVAPQPATTTINVSGTGTYNANAWRGNGLYIPDPFGESTFASGTGNPVAPGSLTVETGNLMIQHFVAQHPFSVGLQSTLIIQQTYSGASGRLGHGSMWYSTLSAVPDWSAGGFTPGTGINWKMTQQELIAAPIIPPGAVPQVFVNMLGIGVK